MSETKPSETFAIGGCAFGLAQFGIWLYMLHRILSAIDAPVSVWAAFYVYVPVGIVTSSFAAVSKVAEKKELRQQISQECQDCMDRWRARKAAGL